MCQPASEKALGGPASIPCREGAGSSDLSPPPSRIRYKPTCPEASLAILAPDSHPEGAGQVPFARHLLVLVSSSRLHLPHSKAFPLTSSLLPKEPCFPAIRPLLLKESAQSFFSPDSLRFLIRNVGSFIAFSSHLPKVCSFPRFYLTFQRWDFCKCVPQAM